MNASLVAFFAASVVAVLALVWALMERRRASAADTRAWELRERYAETEARMRLGSGQLHRRGRSLRGERAPISGARAGKPRRKGRVASARRTPAP